jgi:prophage regulatory protein
MMGVNVEMLERKCVVHRERLIRLSEVLLRTGLGRSTLYASMDAGTFPRNVQLSADGRARGWVESEIDEWVASRISASRKADA